MNRWCWSAGANGAVAHAIAVAPCWCSTLVLAATVVGAATAVAVVVVVVVAIEPMTMGARGRPKVNACGRLCLGGGLTVAEKNADVALQLRGGGRGDLGDGSRQKCLVENATKAIKNLADPLPGDCACIIFEAASKSGEVLLHGRLALVQLPLRARRIQVEQCLDRVVVPRHPRLLAAAGDTTEILRVAHGVPTLTQLLHEDFAALPPLVPWLFLKPHQRVEVKPRRTEPHVRRRRSTVVTPEHLRRQHTTLASDCVCKAVDRAASSDGGSTHDRQADKPKSARRGSLLLREDLRVSCARVLAAHAGPQVGGGSLLLGVRSAFPSTTLALGYRRRWRWVAAALVAWPLVLQHEVLQPYGPQGGDHVRWRGLDRRPGCGSPSMRGGRPLPRDLAGHSIATRPDPVHSAVALDLTRVQSCKRANIGSVTSISCRSPDADLLETLLASHPHEERGTHVAGVLRAQQLGEQGCSSGARLVNAPAHVQSELAVRELAAVIFNNFLFDGDPVAEEIVRDTGHHLGRSSRWRAGDHGAGDGSRSRWLRTSSRWLCTSMLHDLMVKQEDLQRSAKTRWQDLNFRFGDSDLVGGQDTQMDVFARKQAACTVLRSVLVRTITAHRCSGTPRKPVCRCFGPKLPLVNKSFLGSELQVAGYSSSNKPITTSNTVLGSKTSLASV